MTTTKLFYLKPELFDCDCSVLACRPSDSGGIELILAETPFYPEGGGQPCDTGSISGQAVRAVYESDGVVRHHVDWPAGLALPAVGSLVSCRVDAARRQDHSCQHSAQHLLSATVLRLLDGPTRSFHLGEAYCSIDVDLAQLDASEAALIEREVQSAIDDGYSMQTHVCSHEEALRLPLRRPPPETAEPLRIVEIDGYDCTPCCGTHVGNTSRLGLFRLLRHEKYKGMTRIYFLAGQRAIADYRRLSQTATEASRLLGCNEADIMEFVKRLSEKTAALEYACTAAAGENAVLKAALMLDCATKDGHPALEGYELYHRTNSLLASAFVRQPLTAVQRIAKACAERGYIALLFCEDALTLVGAAPEASKQLGTRLKPLLSEFNAKGGGGPVSFQAAFANPASGRRFIEAACGILAD